VEEEVGEKLPGWTLTELPDPDRSYLCHKVATHQKASLFHTSSARESTPKSEMKRTC